MKSVRIKIKDVRRLRLFCFIVFFTAVIFLQSKWLYSFDYPYIESVAVANGDSLWSIAQRHKSEREDTRDFIERIKEINAMQTSEIFDGQELKIPVAMN